MEIDNKVLKNEKRWRRAKLVAPKENITVANFVPLSLSLSLSLSPHKEIRQPKPSHHSFFNPQIHPSTTKYKTHQISFPHFSIHTYIYTYIHIYIYIERERERERSSGEIVLMGTLQTWRKAYGALKDSTKVGLAHVNSDYAVYIYWFNDSISSFSKYRLYPWTDGA